MMQLSERQQKTIAVAVTIVAAFVIGAALLGLVWVLAQFLQSFAHVFLPLAVAGIGALVFQPYYDWLRSRLPVPVAIGALLLSVLIPIVLLAAFFGMLLMRQGVELASQVPVWWKGILADLEQRGPEIEAFFTKDPVGIKIVQALQGQAATLATILEKFASTSFEAGTSVAGWVGAMLSWAIAPVYFVFFLTMKRKDLSQLEDHLPFLREQTRQDVVFLANEFVTIIVAFFRGQIIIAFLQGLLLAIGFSLIGLKYGLVLGFLLGFLNVIPYLGSMIGLTVTLPLAYFQDGGGMLTLAGVVIVMLIVQAVEGYVLTPKIMGDRTGLHPMAIIFAVFFWGSALGGVLGMIMAIPLTAFLVVMWRLAKEKYISELV